MNQAYTRRNTMETISMQIRAREVVDHPPIDKFTHIAVLKEEIRVYESRIQPSGTGYLYDAIAQLKRRIEELEGQ